jgi:activating signal cointegrator 1
MIFVDSIQYYPRCRLLYKHWCHMATDSDLSELHAMARRIGLERAWFQDKPGTPHYDLTPAKRTQALKLGAQATSSVELVRCCFRRPRLDTPASSSVSATRQSLFPSEKETAHMNEHGTSALLTALLQRDTVRTLSMTDPWGTLVALGAKKIETRSWPTPHRGPLAIHIAKTLPPEAEACCDKPLFRHALETGGYTRKGGVANAWGLPLGQIVAVVWLDEVQRISPTFQVSEPERSFGLFAPGRYAWHLSQVYRLAIPLPARGALGVWEWHPPAGFWSEIQVAHDRIREAVQQ